jgi:hypothetical protein
MIKSKNVFGEFVGPWGEFSANFWDETIDLTYG